ncbi:MAG TPA: carbohydrate-binding protein [Micromonosporaceae bacterium]|nr:carbohydrate-binding protein [Micromonosporaceae bacterium]HCU49755.1 carbohydrate-binding protein [Micromonosporaceae bacterium]
MKRRRLLGVAMALAVGVVLTAQAGAAQAGPGTYNVRDYGATGNGSTLDDDAIDSAINAAASGGGGGTVVFPSGTYRSRTIHLKSNITLQIDAGATILAHSSGMDAPESNQWDQYQDYGHSHFHNALMWGENLANFAITGSGTIDGGGNLITGNPSSGQADKILSIKRCTNLSLRGITMRRGGHFMALINGCGGVTIDNFKTIWSESGVRDGVNLINSWDVTVTNSRIEGSDDAIGLKSDFALGQTFESRNIRISDTIVYSHENNALQFGSETCGNFRDIRFDRITILGAGKAGIGMVSMDGAIIEDVHYKDITITKAASPVFFKIGERKRCPGSPPAGRIRNITLTNVSGSNLMAPAQPGGGGAREYASTITGTPSVDIENVTFNNVDLDVPGGHPASDATRVPGEFLTTYPPRDYGTRPSYGWWLRHVRGITFNDSDVSFASNDDRPAFITDDGANIVINRTRAERGSGSAYDVGFSDINGYALRDSTNTSGGELRLRATNSTPLPGPGPSNRHEAENGTCDGTIDSNHLGFSGTGFCNTTNAVGSNVTWTVNAAAAGPVLLKFGYANGATVDKPMTVTVNGAIVGTVAFAPTGAWTTWVTAPANTSFNAGSNVVRLTATTAAGGPNVDYVDVEASGPAPSEYQAESCTISQGIVESNHAGFTGTGFVNGDNVIGSYVECSVAGPVTSVAVRYANGTTTNRPMTLNGATVNFPGTGAWTTWNIVHVQLSLGAGTHLIRLTSTTVNGGPNLDRIGVVA